MRRFALLVAGLALLAGVAATVSGGGMQADARWVISDLGTFGGPESTPMALNERGQVVGAADTKARSGKYREPIHHAFLWQGGKMIDLGAQPGLPQSVAVAVNDRGQVVVIAQAVDERNYAYPSRAYLLDRGRVTDLGARGKSSVALAINERGQIIGCFGSFQDFDYFLPDYFLACYDSGSFLWQNGKRIDLGTREVVALNNRGQVVGQSGNHAFLWQDGTVRDLGTLGGKESEALTINERGEAVGSAQTKKINRADDYDDYGSPMRRAFLWANGRMRDLGTFGGPDGEAVAINQRGQVVGWVDTKNTSAADRHMGEVCGDGKYSHPAPHAFLWANGRITDLGSLGGLESEAAAVNDQGQVVGWADTKRRDSEGCAVGHAFVWENGRMTDLGTLPGGKASEAVAINDRGQIIGWSQTKGGKQHAVLWTLKRG